MAEGEIKNSKMKMQKSKTKNQILKYIAFTFLLIVLVYGVCIKIEFLDKHSGAIQAVATLILVVITGYYAWQARRTTQEMNKQTNLQQRPIVEILPQGEWACSFMLKNIGRGAALNIELRVSQIHPNGGFTNLRNLAEDERRELFNLGGGEEQSTASFCEIIGDYLRAEKPDFSYGIKGVFAVIATYEDINRNPYYTISLLKVRPERNDYILKTTKTGDYKSGELEKIVSIDWLR